MRAQIKGDLGESFFKDLCRKADLTPTTQLPDRFGKDLLVEWPLPHEPTNNIPVLDSMPVPNTCIVQIKTIRVGKKSARVGLTAALRLVQSPLPAFVAIVELDDEGEAQSLSVFEIREIWIEKILASVRKAQAEQVKLSKRSISFNTEKGDCISKTPAALRSYLEASIGADLDVYVAQKKLERISLGIDPDNQYSLDVSMVFEDTDALVDAFMGEGEIDCVSVQSYETRFGIRLESLPDLANLSAAGRGTLKVTPIPSGDWTLSAVGEDGNVIEAVDGKAAGPGIPSLGAEHFRLLFESDLFRVRLCPESFRCEFKFSKLTDAPLVVADAAKALRAYAAIPDAHIIRLTCSEIEKPLELTVTSSTEPNDLQSVPHSLKILEAISELQEFANDKHRPIHLGNITDFRSIFETADLFANRVPPDGLNLTMDPSSYGCDAGAVSQYKELLLLSTVFIGDEIYAFSVRYSISQEVEGPHIRIRSTNYTPLELVRLDSENAVSAFSDFVDRMRKVTGLPFNLVVEISET